MKYGDIVKIDGYRYKYEDEWGFGLLKDPDYNNGVFINKNSLEVPEVRCPKCQGSFFSIFYGDYICKGKCKCGHIVDLYKE